MENNHMHNVIAFFVFFIVCGLSAFLIKFLTKPDHFFDVDEINKADKKHKCKYGNVKVGDCITPRDE